MVSCKLFCVFGCFLCDFLWCELFVAFWWVYVDVVFHGGSLLVVCSLVWRIYLTSVCVV